MSGHAERKTSQATVNDEGAVQLAVETHATQVHWATQGASPAHERKKGTEAELKGSGASVVQPPTNAEEDERVGAPKVRLFRSIPRPAKLSAFEFNEPAKSS